MAANVDPDLIDFQPPTKLLKTSSGRKFNPPATDEDIAILSKGCVPKNTVKSNAWALRVFHDWIAERNQGTSDSAPKCPHDLFENPESEVLNYWLSRFVSEVRKQNGQPYPPHAVSIYFCQACRG